MKKNEPIRPTESDVDLCYAHDGRYPRGRWDEPVCPCSTCQRVRRYDAWSDAQPQEETV